MHDLVSSWTRKKRKFKRIKIRPGEVLELAIDQDFVSLDESYFFMNDVICAEAYSNNKVY